MHLAYAATRNFAWPRSRNGQRNPKHKKEYINLQRPNDEYTLSIHDKLRMMPLISIRSCPYKCTFCYHPLGHKFRRRCLDNLFEDIELLVNKYSINYLAIYDELFSHNRRSVTDQMVKMRLICVGFHLVLPCFFDMFQRWSSSAMARYDIPLLLCAKTSKIA